LELTPDQQKAARAHGFSFFPATEAQVQRFTMQKRIFRLDGKPFMVTRDGGFWETHGTFLRFVEEHARDEPRRTSQALGSPPQPEQAPLGDPVPSFPLRDTAEPYRGDTIVPDVIARTHARPPLRRRTTTQFAPSGGHDNAADGSAETARVENVVVTVPAIAEAPGEAAAETEDQSARTIRRSRIGQPRADRSAATGKGPRGKLK
jgi:hypothetical protein